MASLGDLRNFSGNGSQGCIQTLEFRETVEIANVNTP